MAQATASTPTAEDTAKEALLVKAANMNIKQYVPEQKAGQYDEEVKTLLAVDEQTGFQNSIEILVPSSDEVKKYKRWFNTSAGNFNKGARLVNGEFGVPQGEGGGVLLEFVLTEKRHLKPAAKPAEKDEDTPVPA